MLNRVEVARQIQINHCRHAPQHTAPDFRQGTVWRPLRSKSIGVGAKIRLEDSFQDQLHGPLHHGSNLGWAKIRHPFHPLRGQRFEVLKKRRIAGVDTLILRECQRGRCSIAREWTDWADPSSYDSLGFPPQRLDANSLFELVTLLEQLAGSQSDNKKD